MYRRTADGSEALAAHQSAAAGDLIRVGYRAAADTYGVILSIDGRHAVTLHLPADERQPAARLERGRMMLLDAAYELDDAPRWECFYLVTGERPFDVVRVVEAARQAARSADRDPPERLPLPAELGQSIFILKKRTTS